MSLYEFRFRTGRVIIDHEKCQGCKSYPCIKACTLFGTNILRVEDGKPVLIPGFEEAKRRCNECLACELYCQDYGAKGLTMELGMFGLDEYRGTVESR